MKKWNEISRKEREHVFLKITFILESLERYQQIARYTRMSNADKTLTDEIHAWYAALNFLMMPHKDQTEVAP